ncbi:hypothetical protein M011DRAFT_470059 [Sporormia fimetaria CBS 119925]|uniref:Zn(2)-C6 fungal-type domain-containing protein n=1 Tax=Sporormia fimetaria CBS 119925 TaxID=1340428 RepID=A0A6A6V2N3_9PLEO|nr:hypothetical protein M011DRAFT_470059 [Sporormia fimetaria CBS 119925]
MVSRGGRSKGCDNCRRRRVKCDEKRPVCSQCIKRKLECGGPKEYMLAVASTSHLPDSAVLALCTYI